MKSEEYWINVYMVAGMQWTGAKYRTREEAIYNAGSRMQLLYRIHVRLK